MQSQWFAIHTLSGQELKVRDNIEKRLKTEEMQEFIKEVLVPMEKVVEVRNQKKTVTTRKLHPGYVYIDMVLLDENRRLLDRPWYFIRETPGIIGFVGGERPVPVPRRAVVGHRGDEARAFEGRHHPLPDRTLKVPGAPVEEARKGVGGHRCIGGFAVPLPVPLGAWWKTPKHREPACLITGHGGHHIEGPVLPNPLNCEAPVEVTTQHRCAVGHTYALPRSGSVSPRACLRRQEHRRRHRPGVSFAPPQAGGHPLTTRRVTIALRDPPAGCRPLPAALARR